MKALVYVGEEKLDFREVADPVVNSGEQLIKVDSAGICGSDMHAYLGHDERRPAPLILGHEASGIILGGDRNDNLFSKKYLQETFEAFKLFSFLAVGIIGGAVLLIYILYILIS